MILSSFPEAGFDRFIFVMIKLLIFLSFITHSRLGLGAELLPTSGSNETSCQRPFELVRKNTLRAKCFKDEDGRGMNELEKRRALEEASMTDESNDESCSKTNTVQSAKSRRQKLEARFVKQRLNRKRSRRKRVNVFTATETVKTGNLQCVEALEGPVRDEDLLEEVCTFVESGQTSTTAKRSGSNGKLLKGNSLSADEVCYA